MLDIVNQKLIININEDEEISIILDDGTKIWMKNGKLYRKDETNPVIEYFDGTMIYSFHKYESQIMEICIRSIYCYTKDKKLHNDDDDLPSVKRADGTKMWFKDGFLYRENDKPVIEYSDGTKKWYKNGKLNRNNNLPAIECSDGTKMWFKDGLLYRDDDLPTIEYSDGTNVWHKDENITRIVRRNKLGFEELKTAENREIWLKYFSKYLRFKVYNIFIDDNMVNLFSDWNIYKNFL